MYYASPSFFRKIAEMEHEKYYATVYWLIADGTLLLFIPILLIKFLFREKISDFGLRIGDYKFGLRTVLLFILVMLPFIWFVSGSENFAKTYPQGGIFLKENISQLVYYELLIGYYMFSWEFFWRGYMLFGLKEKFGYYSVFIQMIPFFILHRGKPEIEVLGSIFAGLILGIQSLRANSFLYSFLVHWIIMIMIDVISVLRYRSNIYGVGIDSLIKIFF